MERDEIRGSSSVRQTLLNADFLARLEDVFMEKMADGNFRYWEIWGASSLSGDARTYWTDPGSGRILWWGPLIDSTDFEC